MCPENSYSAQPSANIYPKIDDQVKRFAAKQLVRSDT